MVDLIGDLSQARHLLGTHASATPPRRQAFEHLTNLVRLEHRVGIPAANVNAAVVMDLDQAPRLKLEQRLADQAHGDAELPSELLLDEFRARQTLSIDDPAVQVFADAMPRHRSTTGRGLPVT